MGKATKWFRSIFGSKKSSSSGSTPAVKEKRPKRVQSYDNNYSSIGSGKRSNAYQDKDLSTSGTNYVVDGLDANKHAMAVAAATAAVAEAALAAAHAAAQVVRLTNGSTSGGHRRHELAAIKIQSAFRAYLARRALRALRGLVKLQALVRGRIVRKHSADMLRRMQSMARIQAQASAKRSYSSDPTYSTIKSSQNFYPGIVTPKRCDLRQHSRSFQHGGQNPKQMQNSGSRSNGMSHNIGERTYLASNWLDRWMEECTWNNQRDAASKHGYGDDDKNDKILEIDTWKPHQTPRQSEYSVRTSQYFSAWNDSAQGCPTFETASRNPARYQNPDPSFSSGEVSSMRSLRFPPEADQVPVWTAENSPHVHSASSRPGSSKRRGAFSPARSECARSFFGDYLSHPSYMAYTESSRAKVRSQSAPRQRMQFEKFSASRKFGPTPWDAEVCSEKDSTIHFSYQSKGYSGSARLDKPRTPIHANSGTTGATYGGRI